MDNYGLDLHCTMILEEYRELKPVFDRMKGLVLGQIRDALQQAGILVTAVEARVKEEKSLAGKLELKGQKYASLREITDILGTRVITFYSDDVDKIAALVENLYTVDWENSVDKRRMHQLDSFGYMSLHYICQIPESLYHDPEHPEINDLKFEVQMRTALQHVWANMYHDTGYKSGVEVPQEHLRNLNRLAGMLELADDEFSRIRASITDYRRQVQALVSSGRFEEVPLNGDTYYNYIELKPFDALNRRIAAINQAEIQHASLRPYLEIFKMFGFKTLGDIEKLIKDYGEDAYQMALHELGKTDLDIISSTVAVQDLCIVFILENGGGEKGLQILFDALNGPSPYNQDRAKRVLATASKLPFMNKNR